MLLTDEQTRAVDLVAGLAGRPKGPGAPPLFAALTGGPGTGKTTTLRSLLGELRRRGVSSACAAPSGKAAQRMAEATGEEAKTLHRLLGLRPDSSDFEPLWCDVLVVDEASMVDARLAASTIAAASAGTTRVVLLVGDSDQLPPVGPGQPFHDLLGGLPASRVSRLTKVHRQAAESGIVRAAYSIRDGQFPELGLPDFSLVEVEEAVDVPPAIWGLLERERLDPETSQVLASTKKGEAGVEAINRHIEDARTKLLPNPDAFALVRGFRAGTKVIHVKNNYEMGIFNGELGTVAEARPGSSPRLDELTVDIAGERHVYRGGGINELRPAWALTVHKSQGSEWRDVVVVAHPAHGFMLSRRLLYVAITRASSRVWLVGGKGAIAKAVRNVRDAQRDTWLGRRFARDAEKAGAR